MFFEKNFKNRNVQIATIAHCLFLVLPIFLSGCFVANKVEVKTKKAAKSKNINLPITVSNISVVNHQVIIKGTNLESIQNFLIKDGGVSTSLQIESKSSDTIVANTLSNMTFAAGKILDFVLSNAEAASIFQVNFSLCDSTLGGKGFNCLITPNDKEVLSYDASSGKWKPRAVNGLSYQGAWDANDPQPTTASVGDYFIVSDAAGAYGVGDWIVFNGTTFDHIVNSTVITNVFGRTGVVTATEGDYNLDKMGDVDLTATPPLTGDVLKYNGTKWVPGTVSAGGGGTVTSVTGSAPLIITNGSSTPAISISQATAITNGYLSSADWITFNNKQPAITAGTTSQYYRGDKTWQTLDTNAVLENTNLYFTNARALGVPLTGFSTATGAVVATDTVLQAFGKLQGQLSLKSDSSSYVDWSASGLQTIHPSHLSLGAGNANKVVVTDASGFVVTGGATAIEIGYLNGVSSNIQTQLNAKQATISKTTVQDVSKLRIYGANTSNYVEVTAPTLAANKTLTLPDTDGSNGHVLTTDGAGTLRWAAPSGGGGGGTPDPGSVTNTEVSATANIAQSKIANLTTDLAGKEPTITASTAAKYYRGDKTFVTLDTSVVPENSNLYFTNARALGVSLTGFSSATTTAVVATDTVLDAFGKLQGQLGLKSDASSFVDWSANGLQTIHPSHLSLGVGNAGKALVTDGSGFVISGGATATEVGYLNGVTSNVQIQLNAKQATISKATVQDVSKLRIYGANTTNYVELTAATLTGNRTLSFPDSNGSNGNVLTTDGAGNLTWSSLATASPVTSVNTKTGAVTLSTTDVAEGTNQYYTNARGIASTITAPTLTNSAIATGDTLQEVAGKLQGQFNNILSLALTGLSTATDAVITASDTIIGGFGKLQAQLNTVSASNSNKLSKNTNDSITATITVSGAGDIIVPSTPAGVTSAVNKTYVDNQVATASNQWTASGSDIYRSSGKVGIGTTGPGRNLDVVGTDSRFMTGTGGTFIERNSANALAIRDTDNTASGHSMILFQRGSGAGSTSTISSTGDTANGIASMDLYINSNSIMKWNSNGNVGIGTTSPSSQLEVAGVIHSTIGGIRFPDGTTQTTAASSSGVNNSMISGWPDAIKCNVTNPAWGTDILYPELMPYVADGYYYYKSRQGYWLQFNSSGTYVSSIGITTTTDCNTTITSLYAAGKAYNFVKGPAAQWLQNGSNAYYNAGNVGIGTNTPTTFAGYSNLALNNTNGGVIEFQKGGVQKARLGTDITTDSLLFNLGGVERMRIDPTGNVGIGTTPTANLHVSSADTGHTAIAIQNTSAGGHNYGMFSTGSGSGIGPGKFAISDNFVPRFVIDGTGNVGIGTPAPSGNLTVEATAGNNNGHIRINSTTLPSLSFVNTGVQAWSQWVDTADSNKFKIGPSNTGVSTAASYLTLATDGSVGIGTAAPSSKLHVNGNLLSTTVSATAVYSTTGGLANGTNGNIVSSGGNNAACYNAGWGFFGSCTSLRSTKKEIRNINLGIDTVLKLRPVTFKWKNTNERDLGFIAEEVEKVDPLLAQYTKNKLSGVKYNSLSSLLAKAIQEFYAEFVQLKKTVMTLIDGDEDKRRDIASIKETMDKQALEIKILREQNESLKNDIAEIKKALKSK